LTWQDIGERLLLAIVAGALIGLNRTEHGHSAGLRTTILVCLAATVAMIQANVLLATGGKTTGAFAVMDVMRLPLGILSGMGFIGAGAIIRRGELVRGITTAATLWFVTVMGLCFGGGQLGLGLSMLVLGSLVLEVLKRAERRLPRGVHVALMVDAALTGPGPEKFQHMFQNLGIQTTTCDVTINKVEQVRRMHWEFPWQGRAKGTSLPPALSQLAEWPGVLVIRLKIY